MRKSLVLMTAVVLAAGGVQAKAGSTGRDTAPPLPATGLSDTTANTDWHPPHGRWLSGEATRTSFAAAAAGGGHGLRFEVLGGGPSLQPDRSKAVPTPAAAPAPERLTMALAGLGALGLASRRRLRHA